MAQSDKKNRTLRKHTNKDHFRCLITIWSIGIARRELNELICVKTSNSTKIDIFQFFCLYPVRTPTHLASTGHIVFTFTIFYSSCQWITLNPFLSLLTEQRVKIILWQLTVRKELDWQAIWPIRTRILCATVAIRHLAQQLRQVSIEIHVKTG